MSNMSYCRFENTRFDMRDCFDTVLECINEENEYPVSDREIDFFERMVRDIFDFLEETELLDIDCDGVEINRIRLNEIMESMRKGGEE